MVVVVVEARAEGEVARAMRGGRAEMDEGQRGGIESEHLMWQARLRERCKGTSVRRIKEGGGGNEAYPQSSQTRCAFMIPNFFSQSPHLPPSLSLSFATPPSRIADPSITPLSTRPCRGRPKERRRSVEEAEAVSDGEVRPA